MIIFRIKIKITRNTTYNVVKMFTNQKETRINYRAMLNDKQYQ